MQKLVTEFFTWCLENNVGLKIADSIENLNESLLRKKLVDEIEDEVNDESMVIFLKFIEDHVTIYEDINEFINDRRLNEDDPNNESENTWVSKYYFKKVLEELVIDSNVPELKECLYGLNPKCYYKTREYVVREGNERILDDYKQYVFWEYMYILGSNIKIRIDNPKTDIEEDENDDKLHVHFKAEDAVRDVIDMFAKIGRFVESTSEESVTDEFRRINKLKKIDTNNLIIGYDELDELLNQNHAKFEVLNYMHDFSNKFALFKDKPQDQPELPQVPQDQLELYKDQPELPKNQLELQLYKDKSEKNYEMAFHNPCVALSNGYLPLRRIRVVDKIAIYSKNSLVEEVEEPSFVYYAVKLKKLERILPTLKPLCLVLSRNPKDKLMIDLVEYLANLPEDFDDEEVESKLRQITI